jgi:serine/threonine protein kinase
MAPEVQANSKGYSSEADIWSIGCTIVALLTGKYPSVGYFDQEVSHFHFTMSECGGISPLQVGKRLLDNPELAEATECLQSMLKRNPQERPTAAEVRSSLALLGSTAH